MSDQQSPKATTDRLRNQSDASSDNLEPVELLADDFMRRKRAGENPMIEEYCAQHPELADEIREVFPALVVIETVAPHSADLDDSARTLHSPDNQPIESIGDYRVLREIGRGGMGVVYEAEQESLGRRVALKVLPRHAAKDQKSLLRFQREARAAAKMHHTNIVPVFEVGHDKDHSFYAMQLIKGQGLDHVIGDLRDLRSLHVEAKKKNDSGVPDPVRRGSRGEPSLAHSLMTGHFEHRDFHESDSDSDDAKLPNDNAALRETVVQAGGSTVSAVLPGQSDLSTAEDNRKAYFHSVAEIGLQSARALSYAHARGITHRDIKPSNLLLDTTGVVWITDFGLARTTDSSMTQTGDILGTIRYMSPERFKGQCDNRADVYGLGLTLYEMLVLKPAFESPDRLQLVDMVTKTEVASPRSIDSRIPRDLETIVLKAADKDPKRRYQSADDMADDLQRFVNDEPIHARRASPVERIARWSRRNPWLATTMTVAAAALIAVTGISISAAQTQSDLNDELRQAYTTVEKKADDERKANAALVESNRSKEELITELKRSQSRLAEKQAEFVADMDDVAESLLWLGRSLELADEDDQATRSRLLAKISHSASEMPRLIKEVPVNSRIGDLQLVEEADRIRNPENPHGSVITQTVRLSSTFRRTFAGLNSARHSANLQAFKINADADGDHQDAVRCYDTRTKQWTGRILACDGFLVSYGINETKRWLATVSFQVTSHSNEKQDSVDGEDGSGEVEITLKETVLVRDIDSGAVVYESHSELREPNKGSPGSQFGSYTIANNTRVHLTEDGASLIKLTLTGRLPAAQNEYRVDRVAIPSGKVSSSSVSASEKTPGMIRGGTPGVFANGKKLFVVALPQSPLLRSPQTRQLLCIDVGTGQQVGETILFNDGTPLILSPAGDRVAVLRAEGSRRWIQIHDVQSGKKAGESLDLNVPMSTEIRMSNGAFDSNRLVLTFLPIKKSEPDEETAVTGSWVQVFDLGLRTAVTPRLPTDGPALDAVLTADNHVVVRDRSRIRVWHLHGTRVARTLFTSGSHTSRGYFMRALDQSQLRTIAPLKSEGALKTWAANAGRDVTSVQMKSAGRMAFAIDPTTEFLLMGATSTSPPRSRSGSVLPPRAAARISVEVCEAQSGKVIGDKASLPARHSPVALGPGGKQIAMVFQPHQSNRRLSGFQVRVLDRETKNMRDVPKPRGEFLPDFVDFGQNGERLFVIGGPETTLDIYDLTQPEIQHVKAVALRQFAQVVGTQFLGVLFANGPWSVSNDGQLVAGLSEDGHLLVQHTNSGAIVHRVPLGVERSGFFARPPISISPENDAVYIGRSGGLILQSKLLEPWGGRPNDIYDRLRTVTGLEFAQDDVIQLASLAEDIAWTAETLPSDESLDARELLAIEHFRDERWQLANEEFSAWSQRRPDDWIPLALRILPLVELNEYDEADNVLSKFAEIVGQPTASVWLNYLDEVRASIQRRSNNPPIAQQTDEQARAMWFQSHRLELSASDAERANLLFEIALTAEKTHFDLKTAADSIDEAYRLEPDSTDIHYYRAHLMERLNRWPEALESRQAVLRLDPGSKLSHFRVVVGHLFAGNEEEFRKSLSAHLTYAEKILNGEVESEEAELIGMNGIRDTIAKPRLVAGGPVDQGMKRAMQLADENFASDDAMSSSGKNWHLLCKGIAEYRRGEPQNLNDALQHLIAAFEGFVQQGGSYSRGQAITQFFAAMVHYELGDKDAARVAYLDGLDRLHRDEFNLCVSDSATWHEWQLAEIARRKAAALIRINTDAIDPVCDTSKWTVLFEDNFDEGISEDWQRLDGEWSVVDGAACGILKHSQQNNEAYDRLEHELPGSLSTFEVEYETWVSEPMLAACFLRLPTVSGPPVGFRVALASYPDPVLTQQGKPEKGANLMTHTPFGFWIDKSVPDFNVEPNTHYKVRIIRQPQRITVFIDDKQILSERIRNIETRSIRFFARGEEGTKMFIDNVRVRIPSDIPPEPEGTASEEKR